MIGQPCKRVMLSSLCTVAKHVSSPIGAPSAIQCSKAMGYYRGTRRTNEWPTMMVKEHKHSFEEHKAYAKAMAELKSKKRRGVGVFVENLRMIVDLLKFGYIPSHMFYVDGGAHTDMVLPDSCKRIPVSSKQMIALTDVEAHQGIMCVFERPRISEINTQNFIPLIVYLDDVRDPGNIGTIIRSAAGAGCLSVITSPNSCDVFNSKAMRAASAAQYLLPIWKDREFSEVIESLSTEWNVIVAHKHLGDGVDPSEIYYNQDFTKKTLLVLGNESRGVSQSVIDHLPASAKYTSIPTSTKLDSVNVGVAASVIMFEMARQFSVAQTEAERQMDTSQENRLVVKQLREDFSRMKNSEEERRVMGHVEPQEERRVTGNVEPQEEENKVLEELSSILKDRQITETAE